MKTASPKLLGALAALWLLSLTGLHNPLPTIKQSVNSALAWQMPCSAPSDACRVDLFQTH